MSKVDIIDYCGDCSNRYYEGDEMHCDKTGEKVDENMHPPKSCPLPEAKESA